MKLVVATKNQGKLKEIQSILSEMNIHVQTLNDYPSIPDVIEDGEIFEANARKKASVSLTATGELTLADDSGLVVDALDGKPGIHSARYAETQGDDQANNAKLLKALAHVPNEKRQAAFVCSMVLLSPDGRQWRAEGRCEGVIAKEPRGSGGFGYDPLFFIPAMGKTMAELTGEEKNAISHRGKALRKMKSVLEELMKKTRDP